MKRARKPSVRDAEAEVERDRWKCRTCSAPIAEHGDGKHCWSCERYWQDVAAGVFDRMEDWP